MITSLHLLGDSIFDNKAYVSEGGTVEDQLANLLPKIRHLLWANDGDTTTETFEVLKDMHGVYVDNESVAAVLSVGGNDALQAAHVMLEPAEKVFDAFTAIGKHVAQFKRSYEYVIDRLMDSYVQENIAIATIYDKIPEYQDGLVGPNERLALGLYNNVITEIASRRKLKLLDLRVICDDPSHYSTVSPIEPSEEGGKVIAQEIAKLFNLR